MAALVASTQPDEHSHKQGRELEWQMAAADLPAVRRWLHEHAAVDHLSIEARPTLELHDSYFDTDDWRLHRAGLALRVRSASGKAEATLKSLHAAQNGLADRRELSEPLPEASSAAILGCHGPVGSRVAALVGDRSLRELFEVRTTRQRFAVRSAGHTSDVAEIALDDTVVARGHGEPQTATTRVEVEALGDPQPLERLVTTLRTECALAPLDESKYELGLKSAGLSPPAASALGPTDIDASMRMEDIALANLRRHFSAWLAHEPGARLGDDPEELHDLRIATRRMDATLRMFRAHVAPGLVRTRPALGRLLQIFGTVRDLDIALADLGEYVRGLPAEERPAAEPLARHLRAERDRARGQMLSTLESPETQRWKERWRRALTHPRPGRGDHAPGVIAAPELIGQRHRKLRKAVKRLTPQASLAEYHRARRQGKKLRYALESVASLYGKPAAEVLEALRRLQDQLGAQQDAHVAHTRLLALANDPPAGFTSQTIFLMGRLTERHSASATRARKRLRKALARLRGRRWKPLRVRMSELSAAHAPQPDVGPTNAPFP